MEKSYQLFSRNPPIVILSAAKDLLSDFKWQILRASRRSEPALSEAKG